MLVEQCHGIETLVTKASQHYINKIIVANAIFGFLLAPWCDCAPIVGRLLDKQMLVIAELAEKAILNPTSTQK
jgi:hypothetical protein